MILGKTSYLTWFRDRGRGQEAADHCSAAVKLDTGPWPVARIYVTSETQELILWRWLYNTYRVNAMMVNEC